jgi:hypothetical protein
MSEPSLSERIDAAKRQVQSLKTEIEVSPVSGPVGCLPPGPRACKVESPGGGKELQEKGQWTPLPVPMQNIRGEKDDASLPSAARGRNLPTVPDKVPKVRRLLKVSAWGISLEGWSLGTGTFVGGLLKRRGACVDDRGTSARCTPCTGLAIVCSWCRRPRTGSSSSGTDSPRTRTRCVGGRPPPSPQRPETTRLTLHDFYLAAGRPSRCAARGS